MNVLVMGLDLGNSQYRDTIFVKARTSIFCTSLMTHNNLRDLQKKPTVSVVRKN